MFSFFLELNDNLNIYYLVSINFLYKFKFIKKSSIYKFLKYLKKLLF